MYEYEVGLWEEEEREDALWIEEPQSWYMEEDRQWMEEMEREYNDDEDDI